MKTAYLDIPRKRWGVVVVYDYDVDYEYKELKAIMMSFGLYDVNEAMNVLSEQNTGMTISNHEIRMSVIFISDATSESEWFDSAIHELKHVTDAILDYYGVDCEGEDAAYLMGYLTKEFIEKVCKY